VIRVKTLTTAVLVVAVLASAAALGEGPEDAINREDDGVTPGTADVRAGFVNFGRGPAELGERYWGYRFDAVLEIPTDKWGFRTGARVLRFPGDSSSTSVDWDLTFKYFLVKAPLEAYMGPDFGIGYAVTASELADDPSGKFTQTFVRLGFAAGARVPLGKPYFAVRFALTSQITFEECDDEWIDQTNQLPGFNVFPEVALEGEVGYQVHELIGVNGKVGFISGQFLLMTRPYEENELVPYFQFGPSFYF
jgi:hypothetical protein